MATKKTVKKLWWVIVEDEGMNSGPYATEAEAKKEAEDNWDMEQEIVIAKASCTNKVKQTANWVKL